MRPIGLALAPTVLMLAICGCNSTASTPAPTKKGQPPAVVPVAVADACASPLRGSRYSLCGHVTSANQATGTGTYSVIGAPDSVQKPLVGTYTLNGGGFYAASQ